MVLLAKTFFLLCHLPLVGFGSAFLREVMRDVFDTFEEVLRRRVCTSPVMCRSQLRNECRSFKKDSRSPFYLFLIVVLSNKAVFLQVQ